MPAIRKVEKHLRETGPGHGMDARLRAVRATAAADECLVKQLNELVVHRPPGLRVGVKDQGNWRAGAGAGMETSFEASLRTWENDFGHVSGVRSRIRWAAHGCAAASCPI